MGYGRLQYDGLQKVTIDYSRLQKVTTGYHASMGTLISFLVTFTHLV